MSKTCSRASRYAILFLIGLGLSACAIAPQPSPPPSPSPAPPPGPVVLEKDRTPPRPEESPRAVASLRLTEQARVLLENGKVDEAITALERAMNVNPSNGQNYYYLAEAWLKKGSSSQAREFNRLAAMYLKDEPDWMSRVKDQQERIRIR